MTAIISVFQNRQNRPTKLLLFLISVFQSMGSGRRDGSSDEEERRERRRGRKREGRRRSLTMVKRGWM